MKRFVVFLVLFFCAVQSAYAHPHVWVDIRSELVWSEGKIVGVRHHWAFDDMFSTFAVQGYDSNKDGTYSREELASLSEINVSSLAEYDYFTYAKNGKQKLKFKPPKEHYLEWRDKRLILHFVLPLEKPVVAETLSFEIYDPTFFVAFSFVEGDAIGLVEAPPSCQVAIERSQEPDSQQMQKLGEGFFATLDASSKFAAQFANRARVSCS